MLMGYSLFHKNTLYANLHSIFFGWLYCILLRWWQFRWSKWFLVLFSSWAFNNCSTLFLLWGQGPSWGICKFNKLLEFCIEKEVQAVLQSLAIPLYKYSPKYYPFFMPLCMKNNISLTGKTALDRDHAYWAISQNYVRGEFKTLFKLVLSQGMNTQNFIP